MPTSLPPPSPPEPDLSDEVEPDPRAIPPAKLTGAGKRETSRAGHGPAWIITYSDMVTLLMAFFIAIITFSSKDLGSDRTRNRNSILDGLGGSGIAGPEQRGNIPKEAVVWRPRFPQGPNTGTGAEFAPLYLDPAPATTEGLLRALEGAPAGKRGDGYEIHLSRGILFGANGMLTQSGRHVLLALATNLRDMPYDFQFQVSAADQIPQTVQACTFLSTRGGMHPSRFAVAVHALAEEESDVIRLLLTPQT